MIWRISKTNTAATAASTITPSRTQSAPSAFFTFRTLVGLVARAMPKNETGIKKYPSARLIRHFAMSFIATAPYFEFMFILRKQSGFLPDCYCYNTIIHIITGFSRGIWQILSQNLNSPFLEHISYLYIFFYKNKSRPHMRSRFDFNKPIYT